MRGLFFFIAGLVMAMAPVTGAWGQPDCETLIGDLNQRIKKPDTFAIGDFLTKHGLEYTSCPVKNGVVYCFKCLYQGSVSAVEIAIIDHGLQITPPQYGCSCQTGRRGD